MTKSRNVCFERCFERNLDTEHCGCYFHFPQSVYQKVQRLGLKKPYDEDRKFIPKISLGFCSELTWA